MNDLKIARNAETDPIEAVGERVGIDPATLDPRGEGVAKLSVDATRRLADRPAEGSLVLVTGMTPTTKGEGKTVTTVGLGQALAALGESAAIAIREPSLGPVFGIKGGAAGGGRAQALPMEAINLHFTGDIHALTAAHNLLAAAIDAHRHHGNDLALDPTGVTWSRALDVNDRALRELVVGLGGPTNGPPREDGVRITAASELMAILGLAEDYADLRARIADVVVGTNEGGEPVTAGDLGVAGALAALLRDALRPNLVQAIGGVPTFVHGGPFANIAHGTNSILANRAGLAGADYLLTEAGFGAELGAEKFLHIVARESGIAPDAAVLVVTVRGLKRHGLELWPPDYERLEEVDVEAVIEGLPNVEHHLAVLDRLGVPAVVAINRFSGDDPAEIEALVGALADRDIPASVSTVYEEGSEGGVDLARRVRRAADEDSDPAFLYDLADPIEAKLETIGTAVYGADGVELTDDAADDRDRLAEWGYRDLPVCVSKTPYSLSEDPSKPGVPSDWTLTVRELQLSAGAGFIVALTGDVLTMPGLPADPAATEIDLEPDGAITGLY